MFLTSLSKLPATSGVYFRSRTIPGMILSNFAVPDSAVHPMESRELRLDPWN